MFASHIGRSARGSRSWRRKRSSPLDRRRVRYARAIFTPRGNGRSVGACNLYTAERTNRARAACRLRTPRPRLFVAVEQRPVLRPAVHRDLAAEDQPRLVVLAHVEAAPQP